MKQLYNPVHVTKRKKRNKDEYTITREVDNTTELELQFGDCMTIKLYDEVRSHNGATSVRRRDLTIYLPKERHHHEPLNEFFEKIIKDALIFREQGGKVDSFDRTKAFTFDPVTFERKKVYDKNWIQDIYQPVKEGSK
jgi:hypothetical protein